MQPAVSPGAGEESDSVWTEEAVIEETVKPTVHERPRGSDDDSPLAKLVRSISSDDQWDGLSDEENKGPKTGKKITWKTYHDPTIDDIQEVGPRHWNWYGGSSSESEDEIMTSGSYSNSSLPVNSPNSDDEEDADSKTNATMMPVVLLRYLFRKRAMEESPGRGRLGGSSARYQSTKEDKDGRQMITEDQVVPITHSKVEAANLNATREEDVSSPVELLPVTLLRRLKQKITPRKQRNDNACCPLCGQNLGGIRLPEVGTQGHVAASNLILEQERGLSDSKMWRVTLVEESPDVRKVYKSVLKMEIDGDDIPTKQLNKENFDFEIEGSSNG